MQKGKISKKTNFFLRGDLRPLPNKNVQMLNHFFPLLFPKDSESLKILDIRLQKVGAKRPLNGTSKVNRHTNIQTDRRTFRLIESIGPEGRCFENCLKVWVREVNFSSSTLSIINYIKCIPYLPFNFFQLAIKCARPQAEHI